jgi:osmotically-inducible protein OsmY
MIKRSSAALLIAMLAGGMVACTSNPESGPVESTAANAGRVVDDSAITAKVKAALVGDSTTKAYQISVTTFEGKVQLSGFVDDATARSRATQVAQNVEGVRDVENNLEIRDDG